jgi:hypothetical protein
MSPPRAKRSREERIEWNWSLRRLGLARADNMQVDGERHADLILDEIDVSPFESEQLAGPQTSNDVEQDHSPLANIEGTEERLNFFDFEHYRDFLSFGALAYPLAQGCDRAGRGADRD